MGVQMIILLQWKGKVEGAKTNTYKRLPISHTLRPWIVPEV